MVVWLAGLRPTLYIHRQSEIGGLQIETAQLQRAVATIPIAALKADFGASISSSILTGWRHLFSQLGTSLSDDERSRLKSISRYPPDVGSELERKRDQLRPARS